MKKSYLIIFYFLLTNFLFSQSNQWSTQVNLSDSLNDNINVDMAKVWYHTSPWSSIDSVYIVWEQVVDDSTTKIVFKNISSQSTPQIVLHQSGIQYTNPKLMPMYESTSGIESVLYLFYESNQSNNKDIFYLKYFEDQTFSQPIPFATSLENETNLESGVSGAVWQCADSLLYSKFEYSSGWSQPELIDIGDVDMPVICGWDSYIFWLKNINDSLKIYFKKWISQSQQWGNDSLLFDNGSCTNLSNSRNSNENESLSWNSNQDSISQIYFWNTSYSDSIIKLEEYLDFNKYEPTHLIVPVPLVTYEEYSDYPLTSFVLDSSGKRKILANDYLYGSNNFLNLSGNSILNRNPKLFEGEWDGYYLKVYLVWESFQNNHWQLKMRCIQFLLASIDDDPNKSVSEYKLYQNYPNPFNPSTRIKYALQNTEKVKIEVFNLLGQKIKTLLNKKMPAGAHQMEFDARGLPSGVYLYRITAGNYQDVKKMILLR